RMRKKRYTFEQIGAQLSTSVYQVAKVYAQFTVAVTVAGTMETKTEASTG
ncbi:MAG: hypothetical protein JWN79_2689, partial [Gemmatimonadetes bacterium]|nr:hypothetical protein [Gemmatimonadota bacterium]